MRRWFALALGILAFACAQLGEGSPAERSGLRPRG